MVDTGWRNSMQNSQNTKAYSKSERRQAEILRGLMDNGDTQIKELAARYGVSLMTIHRDLTTLQDQGLIRRIRGTVSAEKSLVFESSYLFRSRQHVEEKQRLAKAAIEHIEPGNAIIWDDSSTTYQVCDYIDTVTPVTVITNALPVINRLHNTPDIELIAVGGKYNRSYGGFFGLATENAFRSFHVDVALLSTTTIQGLSMYTQDEQVVRAKRAMIDIATKKILLVDSSKFHFTALNYVADLTVFDTVLLPRETEKELTDRMINGGVSVQLV